jgi:oligopeptide/dipeptide ABC transporter ATP-binding protein
LRPTSGSVSFNGIDLFNCTKKQKSDLSKQIQIIFQDPYSSLDPRFTVGRCIAEPLSIQHWKTSAERRERVKKMMDDVGLNEEQITKYPHEFSGGQRQRIGIARALVLHPSLVVCDEPVSALDVSIQAQILNLMRDLQRKYKLTYVFISHNLSVVRHISDRIAVMYLGRIMEMGKKHDFFNNPLHPYSRSLLDAIPIPDPNQASMNEPLQGDVPNALDPPQGCVFHTRCKFASELCRTSEPDKIEAEDGHFVSCFLYQR